jgi:hypothetical protein
MMNNRFALDVLMKQILIYLFAVYFLAISASAVENPIFKHPGMLDTRDALDRLRLRAKSKTEPWASAWRQLADSPLADLSRDPKPVPVVNCGPYNKPNIGGTEFYDDGNVAYTMALLWYATGDERYAKKTIEYLNAWSKTLKSVINDNKELKIGVAGIKYLSAAEIIKCSYKGWAQADQKALEHMILKVWYPVIFGFRPSYNGNWDAAICQTMMCMGVYLDRPDIFERAYKQLLEGESNGAIKNYFKETGQCQESGRDQGHTQMGLSYLANACEIAWNQGRDLYAAYDNRLAKGYEYTCKFMLGGTVPYDPNYPKVDGRMSDGADLGQPRPFRGNYSPIYERAYHHYHDRTGLPMIYTKKVLGIVRNETEMPGFMPWGTLMAAKSLDEPEGR